MSTDPDKAGTTAWVIGSGGLLGQSVAQESHRAGLTVHRTQVPWGDLDAAVEVLVRDAASLIESRGDLRVLWCAGAGVVGSSPEDLKRELDVLGAFLARLTHLALESPESAITLFLVSSAGGVYAGSAAPPFTENTEPRPISPYGEVKLAAEQLARDFAQQSGVPVLIGRIANLYGPGQDISKPQGLVSQLCRSHIAREPLMIYVPLDTARDYLFVDDAGRMVVAGTEALSRVPRGTVVVKILASQVSTSLAAIIGELRRITKHRPRIVLGTTPMTQFQSLDLRFRSVVWNTLDPLASTPLPVGMAATMASLAGHMRAARLFEVDRTGI